MQRRHFLAGAAAPLAAQGAASGRSVLMLIADDQSLVAGCYGHRVIRTPNLDRLAGQGVRFTQAFCTTASCSASRSVLLTGLHNHANGQFGHAHAPHNFHTHAWVQSIPRIARAQGARTGVIGKLHVNPPEVYPWDFRAEDGGRDVFSMAQQAGRFLRETAGRPFYLHVGYADPHRAGRGFGNDRAYPHVRARKYSPADVEVPAFLPDTAEVRAELAGYYESIDRLDQGVGFMLESLEKSGRAKDTLVIYVSDNGMPFPGAKASCYDTGLQVPLIVSSPLMKRRGHACDALAHFPDIAPTVCDWMGWKPPEHGFHGRSLLPALEQESPAGWDEIFFSHTFHEVNNYYPFRGLRTRTHKYIRVLFPELQMPLPSDLFASAAWQGIRARGDRRMGVRLTASVLHHLREELYDIRQDPYETNNLANDPAHAGRLQEMREKVRDFRRRTKDPWFIEEQGLG
jgi:N-sulfoglucosamine sulfohydrolase